jgi:hypothetical protein
MIADQQHAHAHDKQWSHFQRLLCCAAAPLLRLFVWDEIKPGSRFHGLQLKRCLESRQDAAAETALAQFKIIVITVVMTSAVEP